HNSTVPQNKDSEQRKPPIPVPATKPLPRRNRVRNGAPKPSVMQMERIVGAGSFRDTEPPIIMKRDSDMGKTLMDLFLGQAMEGEVQKKTRETGEWLSDFEGKERIRKGILMFMFQWILPIWAFTPSTAFGAIKLPFSNPFLDDMLM
ncbi:probable NAD(P)H dehydrogenase subunit CRR3, chloroplastic, partial [Glycine max]|uniref:probable NAD(P)H dehydrogenase subunit CRR3, chloroplastic n=1 Tax=Glycine max TaxID=3847 RepID=UPI001B35442D